MSLKLDITGERHVVSTLDDYRAAVAQIVADARHRLCIYTPDLEPVIYDHDSVLEQVKRLVLARRHSRVRVLIRDPLRAARDGHRFMQMARRLTSCIALRCVPSEERDAVCAYILGDNKAIAYRPNAERWIGFVERSDDGIDRRHVEHFEQVWTRSRVQPELRPTAAQG